MGNTMKATIIIAVVLCTVAIAAASDDSAIREDIGSPANEVVPESEFKDHDGVPATELVESKWHRHYRPRHHHRPKPPPPPPAPPPYWCRHRTGCCAELLLAQHALPPHQDAGPALHQDAGPALHQ